MEPLPRLVRTLDEAQVRFVLLREELKVRS
jgi:hypothetical protein